MNGLPSHDTTLHPLSLAPAPATDDPCSTPPQQTEARMGEAANLNQPVSFLRTANSAPNSDQ
jgi:hypothetical protein